MVEVVIASLVASIVAGGTLMAFVTAARMTASQDPVANAEASALAQETVEKFRNFVGDDAMWNNWLTANADGSWHSDPPVVGSGGSESKLTVAGAKRCYRVTPADCDGDGAADDCVAVQSRVCWNNVSNCPC